MNFRATSLLSLLALAATVFAIVPAHATPIEAFSITDASHNLITWQLPTYPTSEPNQHADGYCAYNTGSQVCLDTMVTINGVTSYQTMEFFGNGGGFLIMAPFQKSGWKFLVYQTGVLEFHGSTSAPMFFDAVGTTTNVASKNAKYNQSFIMTKSPYVDPPAAAAEPSSLLLLGTGVLGLAGMVRRKLSA